MMREQKQPNRGGGASEDALARGKVADPPDEGPLRRYLLGTCPLEEEVVIDHAIMDKGGDPILNVIEDELIEDYVTGKLDESDRSHFESRFLSNRQRMEKIRLSAALLGRPDVAEDLSRRAAKLRASRTPMAISNDTPKIPTTGHFLSFHSLDSAYLERLRAGDLRTHKHFLNYFTALIGLKLRSRLRSREALDDLREETFARFYVALREGKIARPDLVPPFINSICNNVLLEHYRTAHSRQDSLGGQKDIPSHETGLADVLASQEIGDRVRLILEELGERDRRLLREVFLEERDKDEACRELGVTRDYLRILLHKIRQSFRTLYLDARKRKLEEKSDG